jgi:hypothetical protein
LHVNIRLHSVLALVALLCVAHSLQGADTTANLAQDLKPICAALAKPQLAWTATIDIDVGGKPQRVDASFARFSAQSFDLRLTHADYALELRRRQDSTALALPKARSMRPIISRPRTSCSGW